MDGNEKSNMFSFVTLILVSKKEMLKLSLSPGSSRRPAIHKVFPVQNTNATERAYTTQKIIADAGLNKGVALSMQSLDPHTLKTLKGTIYRWIATGS